MSNPRSGPSRNAEDRESFGRVSGVSLLEIVRIYIRDRLEADKLQHRLALTIYESASDEYGRLRNYAAACNVSFDRLVEVSCKARC